MSQPAAKRPGAWRSLMLSLRSWRTASVALLSFSSGLPLGLVWIAIPDWMRSAGVDIKTVGLMTLAQAPWTFKFLWSPLMDRYAPPFGGRRRGWMLITQALLLLCTLSLAGVGSSPDLPWIVAAVSLAVAFASASQDIAIDAYAVDVLRPEEQGVAVGARIALYRAAMSIAGGLAIALAARIGWPFVTVLLAALYLPMMLVAWRAPEPEQAVVTPRTLRDAVWLPFLGFLSRHRALEILAFVLTYKLSENLGLALLRPFLVDMGYNADDRGIALTVVSTTGVLFGAFLGGWCTNVLGLGRALWIFGFLQIVSNVGYVIIANGAGSRPLMYGAMGFESLTQGLGTGAFSVLLIRLTQKRFSATQYALFSSMFGIPRLVAGPISGFLVDAIGWKAFFWSSMLAGIPGLVLLARFVPIGVREPVFEVEQTTPLPPLSRAALTARGVIGFVAGTAFGLYAEAALQALKAMRGHPDVSFAVLPEIGAILQPDKPADWLGLLGLLAFGAICGLLTAAVAAARRGEGRELAPV